MSEASKLDKKAGDEPRHPSGNSEVSEIAWQKWIDKNKERDAAYRRKLIRILWLVSLLLAVSAVVWQLTVRK
jgi:hypothetical protein